MITAFRNHIPDLYFFSIAIVLCGLPTSMFLMSIGTLMLSAVWILEAKFAEKWKRIKSDRNVQWMIAFYFLHVLALLYTSNFEYAFKDLRVKMPLLVFPLILGTATIPKERFSLLLKLFIAAVLFSTLYSLCIYLNWINVERDVNDVRSISRFISHIRLSMNICLAVLLLFFFFKNKDKRIFFFKILLTIWFLYFLYILESATGVLILFSCALAYFGFHSVNSASASKRMLSLLSLGIIFISAGLFFYIIITHYYQPRDLDISNLDKRTKSGEIYQHDTTNLQLENGHYIWLYIAPVELEETWDSKSEITYHELDKKGQPIKWTLIRYMTSKGLRKDKEGVNLLTEQDIKNIENGITSAEEGNTSGLVRRIKVILYEFDSYFRGITPNGNSVTQRFEYWRVGWSLFISHPIIGVGTGDVNDEYRKQYRVVNSELIYKFRNRAHNQFLTVLISFGIVGFTVFMISLFIPFYRQELRNNLFYILFFVLIIISMMGEDTLETQAGVTFFAFFNSFFLFQLFSSEKE